MLSQAFLLSTGVVALAEIGDKTQLLALLLATRFKKPVPIIAGIFVSTIFNHFAAAWLGQYASGFLNTQVLKWLLAASFVGMAIWMLIPDKLDDDTRLRNKLGVFGATVVAFFMAEMGDKTQIATMALSARYHDTLSVVMGTTLGMMIANVPAVLLGEVATRKLPIALVHRVASVLFLVIGALTLMI
ncbi:TMEM165/GDT1 family protein [Vogesella sp. LIG4]|uniref:TMEM165/GDT1 family protein n=1 Tax=Vogesella sp. LIG4 TaxID=1192162 RepID=UPI00081FC436|nr:TMEM165/GDT1 family protein [Vogesella sp. LIG4]SCK05112.1 Putative Ca2+/H+ antiporter, TMEM165/GDT1 family [Vogesella sp. LIG4]